MSLQAKGLIPDVRTCMKNIHSRKAPAANLPRKAIITAGALPSFAV